MRDPRPWMVRFLSAREGLDPREFQPVYYEQLRRMAAGRSGLPECYRRLRQRFSLATPYADFRDLLTRRSLSVYPSVVRTLRGLQVRAGPRVVFASNVEAPVWRALCRRYDLGSLVEGAALSFRLGVLKPSPSFFRSALRIARSDPAEALYLDDLAENVAAASALGIRSRVVRSPSETVRILRGLGAGARRAEGGRAP